MQNTAIRPKIMVSSDGPGIVSHTGGLRLTEVCPGDATWHGAVGRAGTVAGFHAVHDPGKIVTGLAVAVT